MQLLFHLFIIPMNLVYFKDTTIQIKCQACFLYKKIRRDKVLSRLSSGNIWL